ncbi:hypothetical protein NB724_003455 [Pantoea ananatis]|nr:hypothetical protein [Pantoea ananatis]MCW0336471.1 hypothetical protein [Pantoea ananatis]MCW0384437.1 hypothetical protein [Pantoea ananatis]MCW0409148.1 hypothetical protein [Pantoea ananatis]MCW0429306.1 hypothetical protein [Pantoea ananatis]
MISCLRNLNLSSLTHRYGLYSRCILIILSTHSFRLHGISVIEGSDGCFAKPTMITRMTIAILVSQQLTNEDCGHVTVQKRAIPSSRKASAIAVSLINALSCCRHIYSCTSSVNSRLDIPFLTPCMRRAAQKHDAKISR